MEREVGEERETGWAGEPESGSASAGEQQGGKQPYRAVAQSGRVCSREIREEGEGERLSRESSRVDRDGARAVVGSAASARASSSSLSPNTSALERQLSRITRETPGSAWSWHWTRREAELTASLLYGPDSFSSNAGVHLCHPLLSSHRTSSASLASLPPELARRVVRLPGSLRLLHPLALLSQFNRPEPPHLELTLLFRGSQSGPGAATASGRTRNVTRDLTWPSLSSSPPSHFMLRRTLGQVCPRIRGATPLSPGNAATATVVPADAFKFRFLSQGVSAIKAQTNHLNENYVMRMRMKQFNVDPRFPHAGHWELFTASSTRRARKRKEGRRRSN